MKWPRHLIVIASAWVVLITLYSCSEKGLAQKLFRIDGRPNHFYHPIFLTVVMFLGEFSCIFLYALFFVTIWRADHDKPSVVGNWKVNPLKILPAVVLDLISKLVILEATKLSGGTAIYSTLRGLTIVIPALFTVLIITPPPYVAKFKYVGILFIAVGLLMAGTAEWSNYDSRSADFNGSLAAAFLIIIAQTLWGVQMLYETLLLNSTGISVLLFVGISGGLGLVLSTVIVIAANYIWAGCGIGIPPSYNFEDLDQVYEAVNGNLMLVSMIIGFYLSGAFYNFILRLVLKHIGATSGMVLESLGAFTVWPIFVLLHWQCVSWPLDLLTVLGFLVYLFGFLVYFELWIGTVFNKLFGFTFFVKDRSPNHDVILKSQEGTQQSIRGPLSALHA